MTVKPPRCFVIGPIGAAGSPVRRKADWVLHGLIRPVLEGVAFAYDVKRADQDPNPGSISDAMINDIYEADLVIADLTGFNPNAFYELGIRHAFQKPAIHIIAERGVKPPFDNQDQRTIEVDFEDFDHVEDAKRALTKAVEYVRGDEFKVSNPVTRARGFAELVASGDPKDILLAKLQSELDTMSDRLLRLEVPVSAKIVPSLISNGRAPRYARVRFGEYYNYIRDAADENMQTVFEDKVVASALSISNKEDFVDWYTSTDVKYWLNAIGSLDDKSFKYMLSRESLIKSLSQKQLSLVIAEETRRAAIKSNIVK